MKTEIAAEIVKAHNYQLKENELILELFDGDLSKYLPAIFAKLSQIGMSLKRTDAVAFSDYVTSIEANFNDFKSNMESLEKGEVS